MEEITEVARITSKGQVTIPVSVRERLNLHQGDKLAFVKEGATWLIRKGRSRYKLTDLLAQCDLTAPMSDEITAWEQAPPIGREIV